MAGPSSLNCVMERGIKNDRKRKCDKNIVLYNEWKASKRDRQSGDEKKETMNNITMILQKRVYCMNYIDCLPENSCNIQ